MGTKVESKSYLPGYYYSMRDMNEDSNSTSWPLFYTDKSIRNGQYYNGFTLRTVTNTDDKNALKQKMLEHEAIFKNQVCELHRLYRIQRDMMEEVKQKELHKRHISIDTSSSSSFLPSQIPSEDPQKWQIPSFLGCTKPSTLGADVINSPLSCTRGYNTTQAGPVPPQNGWSSKDCEILESRPSKIRKKLFDLELPAEEYIDTEEGGQLEDNKISDTTLKSDSCFRSSIGFADLNAPVQVEAAVAPTSVDFLGISGHPGETRGLNIGARSKLPFLGLPSEFVPNFQHGSNNWTSSNRSIEDNKGNGREWLLNISEPGNSKSNLNCIPRSFQSDKLPISSHPNGRMFNKAHQQHNRGIEISDRTQNHCNYNHQELVMASRISSPYPFVNSTDPLSNSWSHSVSSWGKPLTSVQTHPSFNSSVCWSRNPHPSDQSHEIFGDRWHVNGNSRSNPVFASETTPRNGFYHGFPSGSKELSGCFPSSGFDYPNCHKGTNFLDLKSTKDVNQNLITKISSTDAVPYKDLDVVDKREKCQDRLASLPWLRAKPAGKNEGSGTRSDPISVDLGFFQPFSSNSLCKNETVGVFKNVNSKDVASASSGGDVDASKRRILGFPIFENRRASKNESSSLISPSEAEDVKVEGKRRLIDINVACDPTVLEENVTNEEFMNLRNQIDLNSCVTEDEDALTPCVTRENPNRRIGVEIDLEAPVVQESEESTLPEEEQKQPEGPLQSPQNVAEHPEDEFVRTAAESIVAMSVSSQHQHIEESASRPFEASLGDPLLWFVDIVSSCAGNLDRKSDKIEESPASEIDYFEAMTLQLVETKEEDYMPKPFVPETQDPEENGAGSLSGRTRRGQSRRGRQRRDFQRDILPGLTSLARHEVTEDLQTFGGLMRATGHNNWQSGLARRNCGGAGRRRRLQLVVETPPVCTSLMEHLQNIEVGLEDRSLTGWGKTTRRPRRQRCPAAGNTVAIALT